MNYDGDEYGWEPVTRGLHASIERRRAEAWRLFSAPPRWVVWGFEMRYDGETKEEALVRARILDGTSTAHGNRRWNTMIERIR